MAEASQRYLDPKTLDRIKRLDVRARVVVEGFITGEHRSPYNGFAVEFASHREYAPGDDTRHIDWKVWSKTDRLYIKEYEEETNLKCNLLLDSSKSMRYGDKSGWSKFDYAATLAASMAYLMQQQQDAVGLSVFNTELRLSMPPSTHPSHLKQLLHELEQTEVDAQTDVESVFTRIASEFRRRGMLMIISDLFVKPEVFAESLKQFKLAGHDIVVFHIMHNDELEFPFQDNTMFRGLESDVKLSAEPRALRRAYIEAVERFLDETKKICAGSGVDYVLMNTSEPLDGALASYLTFRQKIKRRQVRR